ncbi:efflux RND transporter periplasmic adaptor subunit [Aquamicrobium defluvii]|uniref:Membrane fusion protein (Multidrug efflux system) n=1 Tax=Aquamicrobium defluvii TaxID=69279 RepID=A0A011USM9_9HYPH|nr:efflux RND transporter periplasmic adaptor subunit [Aquamicrobium defluvii]EXL09266.1 RND transporter MFP subunit [Aquamicrobium defluvii]EZQ17459.1 RND transporter MFP subunit [Halopseudomonas bauzanensis]TDR37701.1 membrane fusion protein (multidrug efflux system) [Aquamicrobium defluvii]
MIKRFIIAFILLVIVCGGIVGFNLFRDKAIEDFFANMPVNPLTVSTARVEPTTWTPNIEAIGTVSAASGVDLTVETTGIVKEILFKANERVERGQELVRLDDAVQKADLEAGKTQEALDKQALDRAVALQKRGVGTDATLDAARASWQTSISQVAKLQAVLDQKLLKAPFSGTIGIPRIEEGQYVAPGNAVATLQDLDTLRVDFTVAEQRFPDLKIGQEVLFGLTGDDMPYKGAITGIDPKIDPVSRLVSVRAEISNVDGRLSPGQFVQVRVILPSEDNIIAVPQTALISSLYGDYVYVVRSADKAPNEPKKAEAGEAVAASDGQKPAEGETADANPSLAVTQVFVSIGRRSGDRVEITRGIEAGDEVVTAGQNRLNNGSPVVVDNTIDPSRAGQPGSNGQ